MKFSDTYCTKKGQLRIRIWTQSEASVFVPMPRGLEKGHNQVLQKEALSQSHYTFP